MSTPAPTGRDLRLESHDTHCRARATAHLVATEAFQDAYAAAPPEARAAAALLARLRPPRLLGRPPPPPPRARPGRHDRPRAAAAGPAARRAPLQPVTEGPPAVGDRPCAEATP